jgi:hypothetical protein
MDNTHNFPVEKWMGVVATADRQSTKGIARAKARLATFDLCGEADYLAMQRGWVDSKYVTNHPAPKQKASDKVKHDYALELARCHFAFIVAYSLPSQADLHLPSRTAQKRRLVTFMYWRERSRLHDAAKPKRTGDPNAARKRKQAAARSTKT